MFEPELGVASSGMPLMEHDVVLGDTLKLNAGATFTITESEYSQPAVGSVRLSTYQSVAVGVAMGAGVYGSFSVPGCDHA